MKINLFCLVTMLSLAIAHGQGTFIYDQQSSTNEAFVSGGGSIQDLSPVGQSFTPALSSIDFIRLSLSDGNPNNSAGALLYLNLRMNSITGTILATTATVSLNDSFSGFVNFFFPTSVSLIPSSTYAFDIIAQPGSDTWYVTAGEYTYSGGTAYANGAPWSSELWFREGIVVPEPSSAGLILLGSGIFLWRRRRNL